MARNKLGTERGFSASILLPVQNKTEHILPRALPVGKKNKTKHYFVKHFRSTDTDEFVWLDRDVKRGFLLWGHSKKKDAQGSFKF